MEINAKFGFMLTFGFFFGIMWAITTIFINTDPMKIFELGLGGLLFTLTSFIVIKKLEKDKKTKK